MMGINTLYVNLNKSTSILPLAIFRIAFGFLMCFSQLRFLWKGWIKDCYISPQFHFTYQYFGWVTPLSETMMYVIVIGSALSALFIGLGLFYRIATLVFFVSFTYLELLEKSWYLNHYYFVSLVAFLLIWVSAHRNYALDTKIFSKIRCTTTPVWTVIIFKLQLSIVYFFGGIAKLKSDWLLDAQPLKIWLKARADLPLIGSLFEYETIAYLFSWCGMLYDLMIPFLLWSKRSRPMAYVFVVIFHVLTYVLFNIGMFPWLMIAGSLIFISSEEWKRIFKIVHLDIKAAKIAMSMFKTSKFALLFLSLFFAFQCLFPLRHYMLTDHVLWTENGFRFAWHVMVMEKNGFAEFTIVDNESQKHFTVYPSQYLSVIQEKQMSFQPDMIWQFAGYLKNEFAKKGMENISIYVNSKVALNGRPSQTFINPQIDLLTLKYVDEIYDNIYPLSEF